MVPVRPSNNRLSVLSTHWSVVCRANRGPADTAMSARQQLLYRYGDAAYRYLRKVLGDLDAADEVFQEFAYHLVHGDLAGADPRRGLFRNFVKGTLFHLIAAYRKQQRRWPGPLPDDGITLAAHSEEVESQFEESWGDELLARAWAALAEIESHTGRPYYTVLRFRADHPHLRAPQIATRLASHLGKSLTAAGVRQTLHRARVKFADLLLDAVSHSLENPTIEQLEEELVEIGLIEYCRSALDRRCLEA